MQFDYSLTPTFSAHATDIDKMVAIRGMVIRTTQIIPDMKTGMRCVRGVYGLAFYSTLSLLILAHE